MFPIWVNDGTSEVPTDPIFYVIAKDGIYLKKTMGHFDTLSKVNGISILGECESFATLNIAKIKTRQFAQILSLFREVYRLFHAEVNVILHYNIKKRRYRIDIPPQGVTGASVNYENGLETYKGYTRIGTIHSHAGMSAFHSGTDQHDEEGWDGLHITLGRMGDKHFDISCSIMSNKERFMVNPEDYIEGLSLEEYEPEVKYQSFRYIGGVKEEIEPTKKLGWVLSAEEKDYKFPSKWIEKIEKYKPKPVHYNNFQHFGLTRGNGGNFNSLAEFYQFHQQMPNANGPSNRNSQNASYFDQFDNTFEVDENEWSPCAQCPYRNHKSDILMKQIMEEMMDDVEDSEEEFQEALKEEIEKQNKIDGVVYNTDVERRSPFYVDDKETPHGVNKRKK